MYSDHFPSQCYQSRTVLPGKKYIAIFARISVARQKCIANLPLASVKIPGQCCQVKKCCYVFPGQCYQPRMVLLSLSRQCCQVKMCRYLSPKAVLTSKSKYLTLRGQCCQVKIYSYLFPMTVLPGKSK